MTTGDPVIVIAPQCVRYGFQHDIPGDHPATCTFDVEIDVSAGGRDDCVKDFTSHIAGHWQDAMLQQLSPDVTFTGGTYLDLDSADGISGTFAPAAGHPTTGGLTGTSMTSPQVAYLIHKVAGASRSARNGRMYVPGVAENQIDVSGRVAPSFISTYETHLHDLLVNISGEAGTPTASYSAAMRVVHVHKPDKDDPGTWTWSSSTVDALRVDPVCATQRRRLR